MAYVIPPNRIMALVIVIILPFFKGRITSPIMNSINVIADILCIIFPFIEVVFVLFQRITAHSVEQGGNGLAVGD